MLKIPKGLKKKKKGKKSKRKGEEELFTEEELEKYKKEHQAKVDEHSTNSKENEEWSKFKDLTTGVDSILKKTQGDLDRIKSTSFFQRIPSGVREVDSTGKQKPIQKVKEEKPWQEFKEQTLERESTSNFQEEVVDDNLNDKSEIITDSESEENDADDIFDTSYVEAIERGDVKLTYVPDSPDEAIDDSIFDTSYAEKVIKLPETKPSRGKKTVDIGIAVEVLTGRIDNISKSGGRRKRVIPGELLLESSESYYNPVPDATEEIKEKSLLDLDTDIGIPDTPIDLSVSLHTVLHCNQNQNNQIQIGNNTNFDSLYRTDDDDDEFTQLATESLCNQPEVKNIHHPETVNPVLDNLWSVFEQDKVSNFVESEFESEIDQSIDPFDTSIADKLISSSELPLEEYAEDDFDFDPRGETVINNRRKSTVHIHLTDPSGVRESISGDETFENNLLKHSQRDLLGGSSTDLTQLSDTPLAPSDIVQCENSFDDPFDTTKIDDVVIPGKVELKFLEEELIGTLQLTKSPSDPDFDPRADEKKPEHLERKSSRPENLLVNKSVIFDLNTDLEHKNGDLTSKLKNPKPVTPYYTRELSITDDEITTVETTKLSSSQSDNDLASENSIPSFSQKRRYSEFSNNKVYEVLKGVNKDITTAKVLTPVPAKCETISEDDPFDTSIASKIFPSKTELKLLAKEFSEEKFDHSYFSGSEISENRFLETSDDIFQIKALSPEPINRNNISASLEETDPFDTSFAANLEPGATELKLLETEFLN